MRLLRNLSLRMKLMSLVALIVVAFAVMGAVLFRGLSDEHAAVADAQDTRKGQALAETLTRGTGQAREGMVMMVRELTDAPQDQIEGGLATALEGIEAMRERQLTGAMRERMSDIQASLDAVRAEYRKTRDILAELGTTRDKGLRGEMRTAVHDIEDTINTLIRTASGEKADVLRDLKIEMLMLRRHEKDFIIRGDPEAMDAISTRAEQMRAIAADSDLAPDTVERIEADLSAYVGAMRAFVDGKTALLDEQKKIAGLFEDVTQSVKKLNDDMSARVDAKLTTISRTTDQITNEIVGIGTVTLFVLIAVTLVIANATARPIVAITRAIERLADRDWNTEVPHTDRSEEVGRVAQALTVLRDKGREADRLQEEQAEAERRAQEERRRAMAEMADRFEREVGEIVEQVGSSAQQLQGTAETMSTAAADTSGRVQTVGSSSEQASSNVQTVSSAAQELTNSIDEVGSRINHTSETARSARERADGAREQVQSLAQAADQIGGVIQQIQDIAEKTNLLALNATIEAARAGEAGKGFAVVADEVKSLATQTQKATEDISERIKTVQNETSEAVSVIETVADNMREIDEAASSIASAVEQQISSTREISRNVEEASTGVQDVSNQLGEIGETANRAGEGANEVLSAASGLSQQAETLSGKVETFLKEVRSG